MFVLFCFFVCLFGLFVFYFVFFWWVCVFKSSFTTAPGIFEQLMHFESKWLAHLNHCFCFYCNKWECFIIHCCIRINIAMYEMQQTGKQVKIIFNLQPLITMYNEPDSAILFSKIWVSSRPIRNMILLHVNSKCADEPADARSLVRAVCQCPTKRTLGSRPWVKNLQK